jgi:hypothetical protein
VACLPVIGRRSGMAAVAARTKKCPGGPGHELCH